MKAQIEFVVKGIEYIQMKPVKELDYIYHFHIPKKSGFRYLFSYKREFKGVWTNGNSEPYYSDYYRSWEGYYSTKDLKRKNFFQKEEGVDKSWFEKAWVTVYVKGTSHRATFKTDKEAMSFIQSVKALSGEIFKVIINE
jgi:hypothetical protein